MIKNFLILFAIFILTACDQQSAQSSRSNSYEAIANRIAPYGIVNIQGQATASTSKMPIIRSGKEVYEAVCYVCHASGSVGSPQFGCAKAWSPRTQKGMKTLLQHAFDGFNYMPARGGCLDCTNDEIAAAVNYMVNNSKTNETC